MNGTSPGTALPQGRDGATLEIAIRGDERIKNKAGVRIALQAALDALKRLDVRIALPAALLCAADPKLAYCTEELEALAQKCGTGPTAAVLSAVFFGTCGHDRHLAQQYLGLLLAYRQ